MTRAVPLHWQATVITLALGASGALLAWVIGIPLAFITGPVIAMLLASRSKISLHVEPSVKLIAFVLVGIYLGSQFAPSFFSDIVDWWAAFILNIVMTLTIITMGTFVLMRLLHHGFATSAFATIPGAILAVIESSIQSDANNETVVFIQIFRTAFAAMLIPIGINLSGFEITPTAIVEETAHSIHWLDWLITFAAAFASAIIAAKMRIPSGALIAPMLVTAILVITQLVAISVPKWPIALAFVVVGSAIGADLPRPDRNTFLRLLGHSALLFALMIMMTAIFAFFAASVAQVQYVEAFLAFVPAGLTEATVIATTLNLDVGFVAANNLVRMVMCSIFAPLILLYWKRKYQPI